MDGAARAVNFSSPEFLGRLQKREATAIETVVRTYTAQLFRAALGLGFAEDAADELVQATWAAFFQSVPNFEGRSHVRTYLFGILYNKSSELRRDRRRATPSDAVEQMLDRSPGQATAHSEGTPDPEQFLLAAETGEIIEDCMELLPLKQRTAFVLKTVEDQSTEEVCKIMDVTATNLGVLLHRAKNALRECIANKMRDPQGDT